VSGHDPHKALAAALGRVASGLFVLTARQGDQTTGMLASWVQQCSFVPPLVSVAVHRDREVHDWLTAGALFTLNILDDTQTDMIVHFGKGFKAGEPAFTDLDVRPLDGGGPVLTDALAYLECRVLARHATGDHHLLIAEVVRGEMLGEGHPMVHVRKSGTHY
jgi:flavin reductase (DIM6/NTAB) family NADH-FMN oxidoreductase RutF